MPSPPRSDIDWPRAKTEWERGDLSRKAIAAMIGCKRQSLTERADKEGWEYRSAAPATEPREFELVTKETPPKDEPPKSWRPPSLKDCLAKVLECSSIAAEQRELTPEQMAQWQTRPNNLARALRAATQGAKGQMMADAAGLDDQTLRRALSRDAPVQALIREAHANHALRSLTALEQAQERGDSSSARFSLEKGAYANEYGGLGGVSGVTVNVVLSIGDPQHAKQGAILELEADDVQIAAEQH